MKPLTSYQLRRENSSALWTDAEMRRLISAAEAGTLDYDDFARKLLSHPLKCVGDGPESGSAGPEIFMARFYPRPERLAELGWPAGTFFFVHDIVACFRAFFRKNAATGEADA